LTESKNKLFNQNLIQRVLSALVLIPVVLGAVWAGEWAFFALIALICGVGMHEWMSLTLPTWGYVRKTICFLFTGLALLIGSVPGLSFDHMVSLVAVAGAFVYLLSLVSDQIGRSSEPVNGNHFYVFSEQRVASELGVLYLVPSGLAMIHLRNIPEHGLGLIVYLLLVVWGTDTGAYFAGRIIGGPKLLPSISPKKTWAGLIGGMVFAAGFGYCVALGFDESRAVPAVIIGAVLAVVAQVGDFFESWIKRRAGAKDSGTLIPGHGGVLDRVDGLLFAALFLALVVKLGM